MIDLQDIVAGYGRTPVLAGLSATIAAGELAVVVGPNGAGKSTMLKVATGEIPPHSGRVLLDGRPLGAIPAALLAERRAVLPQSSELAFPFTVLEVVRLGLDARGRRISGNPAELVARALARVDLTGFGGRRYQELSGGEQQRVQLARVLLQAGPPVAAGVPRFLFLDEPVSNLDIRHQLAVLEIARDFARAGGGVLAILHDLNIAAAFADRLIVMKAGAIVGDGPPATVLTDALIERVFELPLRVGRVPASAVPFVLPQTAVAPHAVLST
jgi:iron complex transport system ATP-binding protein